MKLSNWKKKINPLYRSTELVNEPVYATLKAYRLLEYIEGEKRSSIDELGIYLNKEDAKYDLLYLWAHHFKDYLLAPDRPDTCQEISDRHPQYKNHHDKCEDSQDCQHGGLRSYYYHNRLDSIPEELLTGAEIPVGKYRLAFCKPARRRYRIETIEIYG